MTDIPALSTVSRLSERALDAAVGGASLALDAVSDPKAARRRGSRINARVAAQAETAAAETVALPERVLLSGLRALRTRAGKSDPAGAAARNLLLLVHVPAGAGARVLQRIEKETAPPARRRRTAGATRSTGTATGVRRAASTTTRRAATGARRAASGARAAASGTTRRTRRSA